MVFLYIYLGTVVFCSSTIYLTGKAMKKDFKNKGYIYTKKEKNVYKDIIDFLSFAGVSLLPAINLLFGWTCISKYKEISKSIFIDNLAVGKLKKNRRNRRKF